MAFSRSVLSVLLLAVICNATNVPVILWGDLAAPNVKASPLQTTSLDTFASIITKELVEQPLTVVFVEETLSNEDFSRRNAEGKTSFDYIHANIGKASYLPSVEDALAALEMVADPKTVSHTTMTEDEIPTIEPSTEKFIFISLNDAREGESRFEMLRRHNNFMRDTMAKLQSENKAVIAVYTARNPSWEIAHSRVRRQATNNTGDYLLDGLRLYARNINVIDGSSITPLHGFSGATTSFSNDSLTMNTTINFQDNTLLLNFRQAGGYWFFDSVSLNSEEMYPTIEVYSLIEFSYRCGNNVTFQHGNATDSKSLFFEDLKVQPVFTSTNESNPVVFGDSFNCVGFFSAPIWSGLFVVFILLAITFYGIIMMMDIRTMDRFDDPKGKTITINAAE